MSMKMAGNRLLSLKNEWRVFEFRNYPSQLVSHISENLPLHKIRNERLETLRNFLEEAIDLMILRREDTLRVNVEIRYKLEIHKLDFRNDFDFQLFALISLYDMATLSSTRNGTVFIFDKDVFQDHPVESIVYYLRVHNGLSQQQLIDGLNNLWKNMKSDATVDENTLDKGLSSLIEHGMVSFNKISGEYSLTARGHLYW